MFRGNFFGTLRNVYNFFTLYANNDNLNPKELFVDYEQRPELDRWILSKYNKLVSEVTEAMDAYDHNKSVHKIQDFVSEDFVKLVYSQSPPQILCRWPG